MSAPAGRAAHDPPGRYRVLALLSLAELFGMSLWFSASAVAPLLKAEWGLSDASATWLTLSVQLGFVAGTLASAVLNLPDVWAPRQLVIGTTLLGAAANASLALFSHGPASALVLRFLTGLCLAGVYPPGMKILASWFRARRGLALGVLIGALTLGKAVPYLVNAVFGSAWRRSLLAASGLALLGARPRRPLRPRRAVRARPGALRRDAGDEGLREPGRAARELRLLRPHVGALRDVDVGSRDAPLELRAPRAPAGGRRGGLVLRDRMRRGGVRRRGPRGRPEGPDARDVGRRWRSAARAAS